MYTVSNLFAKCIASALPRSPVPPIRPIAFIVLGIGLTRGLVSVYLHCLGDLHLASVSFFAPRSSACFFTSPRIAHSEGSSAPHPQPRPVVLVRGEECTRHKFLQDTREGESECKYEEREYDSHPQYHFIEVSEHREDRHQNEIPEERCENGGDDADQLSRYSATMQIVFDDRHQYFEYEIGYQQRDDSGD